MIHNYPAWFVLIEHWVTRGSTGYTFPFLVGARALCQGRKTATRDEAFILMNEILNQPVTGHVVELTWCADLDAPVFGLSREQIPGQFFNSTVTNKPSIFIRQDILTKWGTSDDNLISNLMDDSEKPITEGHFSRSGKSWTPFTQSEIFRIMNLLQGE